MAEEFKEESHHDRRQEDIKFSMDARISSLQLQRSLLGEHDPAVSLTLTSIGNVHFGRGNYDQARKVYQEAIQVCRESCQVSYV